jgi:hypothetical protein
MLTLICGAVLLPCKHSSQVRSTKLLDACVWTVLQAQRQGLAAQVLAVCGKNGRADRMSDGSRVFSAAHAAPEHLAHACSLENIFIHT